MEGSRSLSYKFFFIFSLLMVFLYATAGIMLLFAPSLKEILPDWNRIGMAILLLLYSIYRSYKLFRKYTALNTDLIADEQ